MEFNPSIPSRDTEELIEIAHSPEIWNAKAVEQAKIELIKRGVSQEYQNDIVAEIGRVGAIEKKAEGKKRSKESYGFIDIGFMALKWPLTLCYDWHLKADGYHRMRKERLWSIFMGMLFYGLFFLWLQYELPRSEAEHLNKIHNVDNSNWEREYYTNEQYHEMKSRELKRVVEDVRTDNSIKVYLNGQEVAANDINSILKIDPVSVRNVAYEEYSEPTEHKIIRIKTD